MRKNSCIWTLNLGHFYAQWLYTPFWVGPKRLSQKYLKCPLGQTCLRLWLFFPSACNIHAGIGPYKNFESARKFLGDFANFQEGKIIPVDFQEC